VTLDVLLAPRNIAILGATDRGAGARVRESVSRIGFEGAVYLVNPNRPVVAGQRCYPEVGSIAEPVDLAVLALGPGHVLAALRDCADAGVAAAVVFAGGFAEAGADGAAKQAELTALARETGMRILGPNCMGYVRPSAGHAVYLDHLSRAPAPGSVALVTQSGSVGIGALNHTGTFATSAVVSVGNEAVVSAADVVDWLVTDDATRAIALFIEDTSRIRDLVDSADRAIDAGKPVAACRAGRSPAGARAAQTHTGALATPDRALRAVLRAHGIVVVDDLDELCFAAEVLATRRRVGRRLAGVTVSGGHVGMMLDLAADAGIEFPEPSGTASSALEAALGEPRLLHNPLDAWADADVAGGFDRTLRALRDGPEHDGVMVIVDAPADPPTTDPGLSVQFATSVAEAARGDDRLWVMTTSTIAADDQRVVDLARESGCPRLTGLRAAMNALGAVVAARRTLAPAQAAAAPSTPWQLPATEAGGYELLGRYGIPVPEFRVCDDPAGAVAAAAEIGYPVVAKTHQPGLLHKTAAGGVALGVTDAVLLQLASSRLAGRFPGAGILVARHASDGVDVLLGARFDCHIGPILLVGMGGTLAELIDDVVIVGAPADANAIREALAGTRVHRLLAARVGPDGPGYTALVAAAEAVGRLIVDAGPGASVDINPVRVTASNAVALDFAATAA
jgi:acyl-CoA synthetase (NDP forming)